MAQNSSIEWTGKTWNPIRGCSRISEGCRNCYAEQIAARFSGPGQPYEGLATRSPHRWTGKMQFVEKALKEPLGWRKPQLVFVNSMSDLFHEDVPDEWIDRIFAVMALAPKHTFQILTKRPERMRKYINRLSQSINPLETAAREIGYTFFYQGFSTLVWPIRNVWLGTSCEDDKTYKERVLQLANTTAAVRFVSLEPLLDDIGNLMLDGIFGGAYQWAIVGGESGPGARPCNIEWIRSIVRQCETAKVAAFVKQVGANIWDRNDAGFEGDDSEGWPMDTETDDWHLDPSRSYQGAPTRVLLGNKKGGNIREWPEDLRIRQMPEVTP